MIYEHRTYTTHPWKLRQQLELYEKHGLPVIARHNGYPVLVGAQETGNVNSYVHVYAFESFEERMRRQAAMRADPQMQDYLRLLREADTIADMECKFLIAPAFFKPPSGG
ncbi:MAG: NIPSNAP family protein [Hyphomicrobiales bacterium]